MEKIANSINSSGRVRIATMQSFLSVDGNVPISTGLTDTVIKRANQQLADITEYYFQEPKKLLKSYEEKYNYLIDGRAQADVQKFISENHSFDDYSRVKRFLNQIVTYS